VIVEQARLESVVAAQSNEVDMAVDKAPANKSAVIVFTLLLPLHPAKSKTIAQIIKNFFILFLLFGK